MKYRALLPLVVLSIVGTLLTGCGGTPSPPVSSIKHLQELTQVGQTFDQFQELMTDALKDRMTIYPAQDIATVLQRFLCELMVGDHEVFDLL